MEYLKLAELLSRIDSALDSRDHVRALRLALSNFSRLPDPAPLRERIAAVLAADGRTEQAAEIYEAVALHWANAGHPARALAAGLRLEDLGGDPTSVRDRFTALYNVRSPFLDASNRHGSVPTPEEALDLEARQPQLEGEPLFELAAERALEGGSFAREPAELPPVALLSQMPSESLRATVDHLELRVADSLGPVLPTDQTPAALVWAVTPDLTIGEDDPTYRLAPGTLLGLNGFGPAPRPTTTEVVARQGSETLRLEDGAVDELSARFEGFADRLANIGRHAFTESLLEQHALFEAVPSDQRRRLLDRFDGVRLEAGTRVIEQNSTSPGLFIILEGEADIIRRDEDWEITIATLGPGELFGEVGLVSDRETQATVVMNEPSHLLFLSDARFDAAATEHAGLAKFAVNLARERIEEVETTLSATDLAEISD